eukprot:GFUD01033747.1.p1 GENE.GFUD01033747.1~~GFUD01033747.1.p1  ORF type:complete len:191 (+),score=44.76 GFUD01033747.1:63-635(+)
MASSIISSPKSPQVSRLRKDMYKKSPVRSPLRQVLKSRCQERIRTNRDKVVSGMRDIQVEGRELVENTIREMVRDEVAAWRGGRKCLSFGYSNEDIEDALNDVEEIENELFGELYGIDCNYEENLLALQKHVVCPMCQVDRKMGRQAWSGAREGSVEWSCSVWGDWPSSRGSWTWWWRGMARIVERGCSL